MTPKALCLQVPLHEVGYLKQKSVCFQEKNNALSVNDVSKRQPDCHLHVAAPFWGSHEIKITEECCSCLCLFCLVKVLVWLEMLLQESSLTANSQMVLPWFLNKLLLPKSPLQGIVVGVGPCWDLAQFPPTFSCALFPCSPSSLAPSPSSSANQGAVYCNIKQITICNSFSSSCVLYYRRHFVLAPQTLLLVLHLVMKILGEVNKYEDDIIYILCTDFSKSLLEIYIKAF